MAATDLLALWCNEIKKESVDFLTAIGSNPYDTYIYIPADDTLIFVQDKAPGEIDLEAYKVLGANADVSKLLIITGKPKECHRTLIVFKGED